MAFKPVDYKKTKWRGRVPKVWEFLCPVCKTQRKLPINPNPVRWKHIFQILLSTAFITLCTWPWFELKGIVVFFPLWGLFEFCYRIKVRTMMPCKKCGFDPYLYLTDVKKARGEIEAHFREAFKRKGIPFPGDPVPEEGNLENSEAEGAEESENSASSQESLAGDDGSSTAAVDAVNRLTRTS